MLQYLVNVSFIWALSLLVFDLFLREESFHSYNRFYLLGSFFMGLLLPLWSLQEDSASYIGVINKPVEGAVSFKQNIIQSLPGDKFFLPWRDIILAIYFLGAIVALGLLLKELFTIIRLFNSGSRSKDGVWTIVETGKGHNPFSAFRYVFIGSKNSYTETQLRIILSHEEQHGHSLHFVDLVIMQLAKIVFWFHPWVYLYNNRLLTVHEYQADGAVDTAPAIYGKFLVEQALLGNAPVLAHSFNRSPVKKRIHMLSKPTALKSKMLLVIPLTLVSLICFTKDALSDGKRVKDGNKITYRGNVFELSSLTVDTVFVQDPVTGNMLLKIAEHEPVPVKMNGDTIYQSYALNHTVGAGLNTITSKSSLKAEAIRLYLLDNMKDELKKLDNGKYWLGITNVVVDKNGDIVYFDYSGLQTESPMIKNVGTNNIDLVLQAKISKKVSRLLLEMPRHAPGVSNGREVNSVIDGLEFWNLFEVKDGRLISL